MSDSDRMPLDGARPHKRLTFDPTINAGHILTFLSMAALGFGAWSALDKRVVVLEEAKLYQRERDASQDAAIGEKLTEIREGLKDVRRAVEDVRQRVKP